MTPALRLIIGGACGALAAAVVAPLLRPLFAPPTGGVGFVTVHAYAKGYDYALVAALLAGALAGGLLGTWRATGLDLIERPTPHVYRTAAGFLLVFLLMLLAHDHPYAPMDPFHEGEHLTPAFLLKSGERPYTDLFFLHGLASDGGLDALVLGDPPSPRRARRLETVLDAGALALLVPIAAELTATPVAAFFAVTASLCGIAAGQLPMFPYYRLAPVLLATLGLLRYVRRERAADLLLAFSASTVGVLWSLDTGAYAIAATAVTFIVLRATKLGVPSTPFYRVVILALVALAMPFIVLIIMRAGIEQFLVDSFVTIPRSIDAIWSLPAPPRPTLGELWRWLDSESARFYLPPVCYGVLLAAGVRARLTSPRTAARMFVVAIASIFVFRTAVGRVAWSHTRYGVPLFGAAVVAFAIEPLLLARRRITAAVVILALAVLVEFKSNAITGAKLVWGWKGRQSHAGLVPYPFATGKGIYTTAENARDLAALNGFITSRASADATILDFSNERALYYLLQRKPPVRCPDIMMLSSPGLRAEAMKQLSAKPPACVIVKGMGEIYAFDGVPNDVRVPDLARWIDSRYPERYQIGRFTVATP